MTDALQAAPDTVYPPADVPTMYFIGVTTGSSTIMTLFPRWAEQLGLGGAGRVRLRGVDCRLHDDPASYRRIVEHIRADPLSRGALVTTHKIDLYRACRDLFDEVNDDAALMGEVSSIAKRGDRLIGHAVDAVTSRLALDAFVAADHWRATGGHVCVLGAGGASIALSCCLIRADDRADRPARIVIADKNPHRLDAIGAIHQRFGCDVPVAYHHTTSPEQCDRLVAALPDHSLVVNATGLGKDAPGSPLTDAAVFPRYGYAWDFNYRGDLRFLVQARRQRGDRRLHVEDGWVYFIHGWTRVIAHVFDIDIPATGPVFDALARTAAGSRTSPAS